MPRNRFFSPLAFGKLQAAQDLRYIWRLARDAGAETSTLRLIRGHMRIRALSAVHLARAAA